VQWRGTGIARRVFLPHAWEIAMNKDIANSDPAEGSREVIERELKRQENEDLEPPHEPAKHENEREERRH
jgi:hypothetical protein